jgi:flagellar hook-basal body complex protein FliE
MASKYEKIDKLLPYKAKPKGHAYIKDQDLQINLPKNSPAEAQPNAFKRILSGYLTESNALRPETLHIDEVLAQEDIQNAMNDAASSFEAMMQIRKELETAYKEFMQMRV